MNLIHLVNLFIDLTHFRLLIDGEYNSSWCINMINVGKKIKSLRNQTGISARLLADKTDLDPSQISKIENGTSKPSLDALQRICEVLDISVSDFFAVSINDNHSEEVLPEVEQLIEISKSLTTNQMELLNKLLKSFVEE